MKNGVFKQELDKISVEIAGSDLSKIILGKCSDGFQLPAFKTNHLNKKYILIVGMPHGNEPVGFWYCLAFIRKLIRNKSVEDYNYLIIPILDYEVGIKNTWISNKFDLKKFSCSNYINEVKNQIEFNYCNNISEAYCQRYIELVKSTDIKCAVFIHQTPTLYGGYYYTNIENKEIEKLLQLAFAREGIPPEFLPQGIDVATKGVGLFGVFGVKNLPENFLGKHDNFSCQEYFDKKLKTKFLTIEIPFYISLNIRDKENISLNIHLSKIKSIIYESNNLVNMIKKSLEKDFSQEALFWLNNSSNIDKLIQWNFLEVTKTFKIIDIYYLLRYLFYKMNYLAIAYQIPCKSISKKAETIINDIIYLWDYYYNQLGITFIENNKAFRVIDFTIEAVKRNEVK